MNIKIVLFSVIALMVLIYLLYLAGFIYSQVSLFSAVNGVIRKQGQPVADIQIKRIARFTYHDEIIEDHTTTGKDGQFSFPEIKRTIFLDLPHEPVIKQDIYIDEPELAAKYGREFLIRPNESKQVINLWMHFKRDYTLNSEYKNDIHKSVVCDLEATIDKLFSEDPQKSWILAPRGKCRLQE